MACPLSRRNFLKLSAAGVAAAVLPSVPRAARPVMASRRGALTVAIGYAPDYDRAVVHQQLEAMLDGIGGLSDVISAGDKVAIKVNLVNGLWYKGPGGIIPTESHQTHPEVVRALVELLRDAGAGEIAIIEVVWNGTVFRELGYDVLADELGVTLINLADPHPYTDFGTFGAGDSAFVYSDFVVHHILNEADVLVSAAKLKCHYNAGVTASMKNLIGVVPVAPYETVSGDGWRSAMHGAPDETPTRLPRVILDLNRARPVDLAVIDAIKTGEGGEGPWYDSFGLVQPGVLLAGKNAVATDSVAAAVIGLDPAAATLTSAKMAADNYLQIAHSLGMGTNRLGEIAIAGLSIDDVRYPFQPAHGAQLG